jgi:uncharacterized protein (TIGR03083 family)
MKTLTIDIANEYRQARVRITEHTRSLGSSELAVSVAACPGWTVKDVVAHLSGAAADLASGNMADAPKPQWTAAQVAAGAGASVPELLDRWDDLAGEVETRIASAPEDHTFFVADILCHEIDIQSAVEGDPHEAPPSTIHWLASNFVRVIDRKLTAANLPALRIVAQHDEWIAGDGAVGAALGAPSAFELVRAMTGRRSRDQIRAWSWAGDPETYLPYLSVFEPRTEPLEER